MHQTYKKCNNIVINNIDNTDYICVHRSVSRESKLVVELRRLEVTIMDGFLKSPMTPGDY